LNGTVYVNGTGNDIWNASDQFHFVYVPLSGNGTIIAHVATQGQTDLWAKAGVMFRNTLAAGSVFADMILTPGNGAAFQYRDSSGNLGNDATGGNTYFAPGWVKLVRSGSTFTGYVSSNGVNWTSVGSDSLTMGSTVYIGLCDTSHNAGLISGDTFNEISINGSTTPVAPNGLTASAASGTSVALAWTNQDTLSFANEVYREDPGSGTFTWIATLPVKATAYLDTGLTSGASYSYEVLASNTVGNSASNTATVTTPVPPLPVSALQTASVTTTSTLLSWVLNSTNDTGVQVWRRTGGAGSFSLVTTLPAGSTSYTDNSLQPGTLYEYNVLAVDLAGSSPAADTGLTTLPVPPVATATTQAGQVQLSWTASTGAVAYNVYRGLTPGGEGGVPYATVDNATSFIDSGVVSGQAYYYFVTAVDFTGESAPSAEVIGNQTVASITVSPPSVSLNAAATQQFTAVAYDQFGAALSPQPAFTWKTTVGSIASTGLLTASNSSMTGKVTATVGGISGSSPVTVTDHAPTVVTAAAAMPSAVTGTTTVLSLLGADADTGEGNLTYTWATTTLPSGAAAPTFSDDGDNSAKNTTVTFSNAGTYGFTVTIADPGGLTTTSSVNVSVYQTLSTITVNPYSASLNAAATQTFSATAFDQFNTAMSPQPAFTWTTTAGSITSTGLLTASNSSMTGKVTATVGGISGSSPVTVTDHVPTVATAAAAMPSAVTGTTSALSVLGADTDTGEGSLTYTWATTTLPSGAAAPTFSDDGDNSAKNTTVTFSKAGTYGFTVTITDPGGLTTTSSVNVPVDQTLTVITVSPSSANLNAAATQTFSATAFDQFNTAMSPQPTFTWTTTAGSIPSTGLLTASNSSVMGTVTATVGGVSGSSMVTVTDHAPTVATAATATPSQVAGTTSALSVLGADADTGEGSLTYSWATTTLPSGAAAPTFSDNGENTAKNTAVTFSKAGTYGFTVTIVDPGGMTTTSSVNVSVNQTLSTITVSPYSVSLNATATQPFNAMALDQFGAAMSSQPAFTWTTTAGSISSTDVLTASNSSVMGTVTATVGEISGSSIVTVTDHAPTVATASTATPSSVTSTTALSVLGADADTGEGSLTHTWATTTLPSGATAPTFSDNGDNTAKNTTVTFSKAGTYGFTVTITDPGGLTTTSSVNVTVNELLWAISNAGKPPFAIVLDQFGYPLASQPAFDASSDTITGPLAFEGSVNVLPAAGSSLGISGSISGAGALIVDAAGTVVLSGVNSYTGGTTVAAGTLVVTQSSAIAAGTHLTVGAGGVFVFDPSSSAGSASSSLSTSPSSVVSIKSALPPARNVVVANVATAPLQAADYRNETPFAFHAAASVRQSVPAGALDTRAVERIVGPPIAPWVASDLAWLEEAAITADGSNQYMKKNVAIRALETVFAQYAR